MKTKLERLKVIIEMFIATASELDISKLSSDELLEMAESLESVSEAVATLADAVVDQEIEKLFNLMML